MGKYLWLPGWGPAASLHLAFLDTGRQSTGSGFRQPVLVVPVPAVLLQAIATTLLDFCPQPPGESPAAGPPLPRLHPPELNFCSADLCATPLPASLRWPPFALRVMSTFSKAAYKAGPGELATACLPRLTSGHIQRMMMPHGTAMRKRSCSC